MLDEKELLVHIVRQQKNCEFSLRFALQREGKLWNNCFAMLKLVKKGTRDETERSYGEYSLGEKLLNIRDGLEIISSLYEKNINEGNLVIPNYGEFPITSKHILTFSAARLRYGIVKSEWGMRFCEFNMAQDRISRAPHKNLLIEGLPYYPDVGEAVIDFFNLSTEHFSSYGSVYVVIPDYRARIDSLKLIFSKVAVKLYPPEIKYKDLLLKVFAKSGVKIATLPDIHPESESVEFDIGFQPDTLSIVLFSRSDKMKIDEKRFTKWSAEEEGVTIERPEEEILSLTKAGESQNLEYKYDVLSDENKNDFIETVIAFLNTNRGIILVGVDNSGNVVGSQKSRDDLQKMIHDGCDPPSKDIKIEEREIESKKIIIVEVSEGDSKPYQSKRDKNFYIRHNGTDMKIERSELFHILEKEKESMRLAGY